MNPKHDAHPELNFGAGGRPPAGCSPGVRPRPDSPTEEMKKVVLFAPCIIYQVVLLIVTRQMLKCVVSILSIADKAEKNSNDRSVSNTDEIDV